MSSPESSFVVYVGKDYRRTGSTFPRPCTNDTASSPVSSSHRKQLRKENTTRRSKQFFLPAIGLQTTVVTTRTSIESEEAHSAPTSSNKVDLRSL